MGKPRSSAKTAARAAVVANIVLLLCLLTAVVTRFCFGSGGAGRAGGEGSVEGAAVEGEAGMYCFSQDQKQCREEGHATREVGNQTLCCTRLHTYLYSLMEQGFERRLGYDSSKDENLQRVRRMMADLQNDTASVDFRPAAHLGILENGSLAGHDVDVPRVQWQRPDNDTSFLTGELQHGGDRLTITRAGLYYIYTSLHFHVHPGNASSGAIVSYVFRDSNNSRRNRRKLLTARESSCNREGGAGGGRQGALVSVYMAGIFRLHEKDEISVRTHGHSLLTRSPVATYFGLHLV